MKGSKTSILSTAEYISGGKNLKTKSEGIAYCLELPFGTIASSGYYFFWYRNESRFN